MSRVGDPLDSTAASSRIKVVMLSGGVGGAKLALGLSRVLEPSELAVLVNTADDFLHLGLNISPDLDTVLYTLAGVVHAEQGWGRAQERFEFATALREQGGPDWFTLGDRDLRVHVYRTRRLLEGASLSQVSAELAQQFGIRSQLWPMSDEPVATFVDTEQGELAFQDWFVRLRCGPQVQAIRFQGVSAARPSQALQHGLATANLSAVILAPSNPLLSIDPILAVPGLPELLRAQGRPIVAVSPLIAGQAVKGPTATLMAGLGLPCDSVEIARRYHGFIDGLLLDSQDASFCEQIEALGIRTRITDTLMHSLEDRERVAREALALAAQLSTRRRDA